jgi:photosystem II stability/assembly factor-like uncharacterized protein
MTLPQPQWHRSRRPILVSLALVGMAGMVAIALRLTTGEFWPEGGWGGQALPWLDQGLAGETDAATETVLGSRNVVIGGGGYVTGLALHPQEPGLIYSRTDMGGFYRWEAGDRRWQPLLESFDLSQENSFGGAAIALDPTDPNRVYMAAGKYTYAPGRLYRSDDRGQTWQRLPLSLPLGANEAGRSVGERLAVNPFDPAVLVFGSWRDGVWRSGDRGDTWAQVVFPGQLDGQLGITSVGFDPQRAGMVYAAAWDDGVYQSQDAGLTWQKLPNSPRRVRRLAIAADHHLYTAGDDPQAGVQVYRPELQAWDNLTPRAGRKSRFAAIAPSPHDPDRLVAVPAQEPHPPVYVSADRGRSWRRVRPRAIVVRPWWTPFMRRFPWVADVQFDPHVRDQLWLTTWFGVWRTPALSDPAVPWTAEVQGHEQAVVFDLLAPVGDRPLISAVADLDGFRHDQGLQRAPSQVLGIDRGREFGDTYDLDAADLDASDLDASDLGASDLGAADLDASDLDAADPAADPDAGAAECVAECVAVVVRVGGHRKYEVYGGATSRDGGQTWRRWRGYPEATMPLRVAVSRRDPDRLVVTRSDRPALYSHDGGDTWQPVQGLPLGEEGPWTWSQPLAADPVDGDTFYYYARRETRPEARPETRPETRNSSRGQLWRSDDAGATFTAITSDLPAPADRHDLVTLVAEPGRSGTLWLGIEGRGLWVSSDRGATFTPISGVLSTRLLAVVSASVAHPERDAEGQVDEGNVYLYGQVRDPQTGQPAAVGVWRSRDRGQTWSAVGNAQSYPMGNLPTALAVGRGGRSGAPARVFVGTNGRGIYDGDR